MSQTKRKLVIISKETSIEFHKHKKKQNKTKIAN